MLRRPRHGAREHCRGPRQHAGTLHAATQALAAAPHPDVALFRAWEGYRAAARGLDACPLGNGEEAHAPWYAAMDRHERVLATTPARTLAGLAVRLRFAFAVRQEDAVTYGFMLLDGERPDDLLADFRDAVLWGALEDAERLGREG